jgi:hypothetical protein
MALAPESVVELSTVQPEGVVNVVPVAVALNAATITRRSPAATADPIGTARLATAELLDTLPDPLVLRKVATLAYHVPLSDGVTFSVSPFANVRAAAVSAQKYN